MCMMTQNSGVTTLARPPSSDGTTANWAIAITPYIPTCQERIESVSVFNAAIIPSLNDRDRMGAVEKYWNTIPTARSFASALGGKFPQHFVWDVLHFFAAHVIVYQVSVVARHDPLRKRTGPAAIAPF